MELRPKVSLLLPNLNNRPYLEERLRSIEAQTMGDWEVVVVDSHSTDGAWEFFLEWAARDDRVRLYQSDQKGIYVNFNTCLRLARGEYVYFATSDDSMTGDALSVMSRALDAHPECGLAHCKLRIIDEAGREYPKKLWEDFFIVRYFGDRIDRPHIRRAPHDGVLHFSGISVYTSLTQLLIRKSLFDRIGFFATDLGSVADFEWEMRATLLSDVVHVPEFLASWRFHSTQATTEDGLKAAKGAGRFITMARRAYTAACRLEPGLRRQIDFSRLLRVMEREALYYGLKGCRSDWGRSLLVMRWWLRNREVLRELFRARAEGRNFVSQPNFLEFIQAAIRDHRLQDHLQPIAPEKGLRSGPVSDP
jgi:GT2 family glycosyltransferase